MLRILVAEDFDILREDLCETLEAQPDMTVAGSAATGGEITRLALETDFDLVLMDIEMENITAGITATEVIREKKPEAMVIFLTAHETENTILTAMATGAVDYVVKGCSDEALLRHIRAAAAGQPEMDAAINSVIMREYTRLRKSEQSLLFFVNNLSHLTAAERDLVRLLLQGKKVQEIAAARVVEVVTVKTQIKGLLHKFGCSRTKEVVQMIRDLNLEHLFM
ncbi:MAG: response regulator transcription factor [Angelakisella sp.]|nr:response regulator transcription factor [Angelakisella sp.]MCI9666563.1 response regulator transcription factor [Angelakisella sp.]